MLNGEGIFEIAIIINTLSELGSKIFSELSIYKQVYLSL